MRPIVTSNLVAFFSFTIPYIVKITTKKNHINIIAEIYFMTSSLKLSPKRNR